MREDAGAFRGVEKGAGEILFVRKALTSMRTLAQSPEPRAEKGKTRWCASVISGMERWEVETSKSLEAHWPVSLAGVMTFQTKDPRIKRKVEGLEE